MTIVNRSRLDVDRKKNNLHKLDIAITCVYIYMYFVIFR